MRATSAVQNRSSQNNDKSKLDISFNKNRQ